MYWAYIAGILDGEGYVGILVKNPHPPSGSAQFYAPRVEIYNTHKGLIEAIQKQAGGLFCTIKRKHAKRPQYHLLFHSLRSIATFLKEVMPYLIVKKPHAELLLKYCESRLKRWHYAYSEEEREIVAKLAELNKR